MKRIFALSLALLFALSACGESADTSTPSVAAEPTEPAASDVPAASLPGSESRNLIAYFTWADNTVVDDPTAVDVDATTSASVLAPGNAALLAGWIEQEIGGDLFSIVVEQPYSSDYDACLDRAADEKAQSARPALATHVEDIDQYDVIYLGFPNWWYTVPMSVLTFVEEYDLSGKTIVPFVTHGTGGLSSTVDDLTAALPDDCTILPALGVYREDVRANGQAEVKAWLEGMRVLSAQNAAQAAVLTPVGVRTTPNI